MYNEQIERNAKIYQLFTNDAYPVKLICKIFNLPRQRVHQIINQICCKYNGEKPELIYQLAPVRIGQATFAIIETESARLDIPAAAFIRIAIQQAINNDMEFESQKGNQKFDQKTPITKITNSQEIYISTTSEITKSEKIRQILKNYKSIEI